MARGDSMTNAPATLTGVWHGLYTYANGVSVSFVATLIESGSRFSGSIHEPGGGTASGQTLYATLAGDRQDNAVAFIKTYDCDDPDYQDPVAYEGALSGDATEIEGRWTIRGWSSGKFLMVRSAGKAASVRRDVSERV
jgi:hypothetical protein